MIIKKLNGMFHKHGRWLFGIITVVIIVSFVGFLAPGQFGETEVRELARLTRLYGRWAKTEE